MKRIGGHRPRLTVAVMLILFVALALRVVIVQATPHFQPQTDSLDYDRHAVSLVVNHTYPSPLTLAGGGHASAFRPPLYPIALASVYELSGTANPGSRWHAGRLAQALLGSLAVAMTMLVAWLLAGEAVAVAAGGIAAIFPPLLMISSTLLTENLFIVLELGAVGALLWRIRSPHRVRWLVLAGVLAGLAALTRGNGLILLIPLALGAWNERPRFSRHALLAPAVVAVVAALTVAPWTVRNAIDLHAFIPVSTQSGFGLGGQYNATAQHGSPPAVWRPPYEFREFRGLFLHKPPLGEVKIDRRLRDSALSYIQDHPLSLLKVAYWNGRRLFALDGTRMERFIAPFLGVRPLLAEAGIYGFLLLAPFAIAGAFTAGARKIPGWIWLIPFVLLISVVFVSGIQRYRTTADPFFIILAALAVVRLVDRVRRSHPLGDPTSVLEAPPPPGA